MLIAWDIADRQMMLPVRDARGCQRILLGVGLYLLSRPAVDHPARDPASLPSGSPFLPVFSAPGEHPPEDGDGEQELKMPGINPRRSQRPA